MYAALSLQAKVDRVRITDLLRTYTDRGLRQDRKQKGKNAATGLLALAKLAEREGWGKGAPKDLAENHTKYAAEAAEADLQRIYDQYR
jgi:hypothetical protein